MAEHAEKPAQDYRSNPFRPLVSTLGRALTHNGIPALLLVFVFLAALIASYVALVILILATAGFGIFLVLPFIVAVYYFVGRYFAAMILMLQKSDHAKSATTREYFAAGSPFAWRLALTYFVVGLIVVVGFILFIIPGFFFLGRLILTPIVLVSDDLSFKDALSRSWQLSRGHVMEVLGSLFAGVVLSNGLLGQIIVTSSLYGRYLQLKELDREADKPKVHWMNWLLVFLLPVLFALLVVIEIYAASTVPSPQTPVDDSPYYLESD